MPLKIKYVKHKKLWICGGQAVIGHLPPVIMAAVEDVFRAVQLLKEKQAGQLVGEGQFREGPEQVCLGLDSRGEAIGPANDEDCLAVQLP